ncbi:DUF6127 family protein [Elioraea sp.]|jgi:hypothetical protein|uniref:DUF6127 family protein n=1 Tax=Elioraea sp. TaxID=2185103 RepID=UPI0021DEE126|nr:DUF6127 family protein [Elioraea sp.]GIX11748.1 MAG: hypothetical protein KatS3mg116_3458 [Elioraea sp.]
MNDQPIDGRLVSLSRAEIEDLLAAAAARGARQALKDIGLDNGEAREDIRELRSLLGALRLARRTAWQTTVRVLTTVFLAALLALAGIKLKLLG